MFLIFEYISILLLFLLFIAELKYFYSIPFFHQIISLTQWSFTFILNCLFIYFILFCMVCCAWNLNIFQMNEHFYKAKEKFVSAFMENEPLCALMPFYCTCWVNKQRQKLADLFSFLIQDDVGSNPRRAMCSLREKGIFSIYTVPLIWECSSCIN